MPAPPCPPRPLSAATARPATAVLAVALAATLAGCAAPAVSEADWDRRTTRLLRTRKALSQAAVDGDRIAGTPAAAYVNLRTALLLGGGGRVTTQVAADGQSALVGWHPTPDAGGGVSSAAAITADGYFLTAAHAVGDAPLQIVRSTGTGVAVAPARVVWKGDTARGGPDLALIHAPVHHQAFFPLAEAAGLPARARVWTAGFGHVRQNQSRGRLQAVSPWRHDARGTPWRLIEHTAPLLRGDSGGPLVDRDGRLLGVNTEFLVQPASLFGIDHLRVYRPIAVTPDARWLENRIARDRNR